MILPPFANESDRASFSVRESRPLPAAIGRAGEQSPDNWVIFTPGLQWSFFPSFDVPNFLSLPCNISATRLNLQIIITQDGSPTIQLEQAGATYHSRYGAVRESLHVFIEAGLFYRSISKKDLNILEIGFGTGLNAFLTVLEGERLGLNIHYTAIDRYPLELTTAAKLDYAGFLHQPELHSLFLRLHEADWNAERPISDRFTLLKLQQKAEEWQGNEQVDLIYYDAFAPAEQPELWTEPVLLSMYEALVEGGVLVTYCAKSDFKRTLKSIGFEVTPLPGAPGKREMTRARKP